MATAEQRRGTVTAGVGDLLGATEQWLSDHLDTIWPPGPPGWWQAYNAEAQAEAAQLRRQRELGGDDGD